MLRELFRFVHILLLMGADNRAGGPTRIMPSALMWAGTTTAGQLGVNYWNSRPEKQTGEDDSFLRSKWSPLKKLTDREYLDMMDEKMLKLDVEIALIDDRIAELRVAENKLREEQGQTSTKP